MPDDGDPTTLARIPVELAGNRGLLLLVMGPTGTSTHPLPERGSVVIGRATECDIHVEDGKLSRRHAVVHTSPRLEIVDLGSMNGTIVHDRRLDPNVPVPVAVGDSITIGSSVIVVQRTIHGARPRHVWNHGYFEGRLEEECLRASQGAGSFAVVRLRLPAGGPESVATRKEQGVSDVLTAWLGDSDVVAKYAPHEYEVLMLGSTPEGADARVAELSKALERARIEFRAGVAAFPRDGRTPEALVECLSRTLDQAGGPRDLPSAPLVAIGAIERMERVVARVAAGTINVLVLGETGVGKEVLARRIHALSPRAAMPMVSINCAAISESLLESELFGHEKGAFTGAVAAKAGLLESAHGGTVFLDEVGEMPVGLQAKLLRVLEQREVTRVGALRPRPIDVRFVAATNRDLELQIEQGRFRQDLYFRLNGIALSLPPLRERVDEIEPLARVFVEQASRAMGQETKRIHPDALALLKAYGWPGNIRELRNTMERAVLLCTGDVITREHLPTEKMGPTISVSSSGHALPLVRIPPRAAAGAPGGGSVASPAVARTAMRNPEATIPPEAPSEVTLPGKRVGGAWDAETVSGPEGDALGNAVQRQRIVDALEACAGNQSNAAKRLGISRGTLIKRIEELGLPRPRKRD